MGLHRTTPQRKSAGLARKKLKRCVKRLREDVSTDDSPSDDSEAESEEVRL